MADKKHKKKRKEAKKDKNKDDIELYKHYETLWVAFSSYFIFLTLKKLVIFCVVIYYFTLPL